ncbi:hypothetical protein SAMN04489860_0226 [Paraoerskovia marina]|uniref:Uncharacterized protein n=1 Tax=Paraoerskovia marina TaxID=545619 RepID=A0A1H1MFW8_9CELL|nr:hypothetical protein [Paraoerskovia marina]SDR85567.1 hypothetical protein SAMN04489860_0226 [Paraoerskovia marina]
MHGEIAEERHAGPMGVVLVSVVTVMGLCAVVAGLWPVEQSAEVGDPVSVSFVHDDAARP